jgi:hypothetical protein
MGWKEWAPHSIKHKHYEWNKFNSSSSFMQIQNTKQADDVTTIYSTLTSRLSLKIREVIERRKLVSISWNFWYLLIITQLVKLIKTWVEWETLSRRLLALGYSHCEGRILMYWGSLHHSRRSFEWHRHQNFILRLSEDSNVSPLRLTKF